MKKISTAASPRGGLETLADGQAAAEDRLEIGRRGARRLELELDVSGRPVRAHAFQGDARVPLAFEPAGEGAWRFQEGSES